MLYGKKVLVVGMARSGLSAAEFLWKRGADVKVSDRRSQQELDKEVGFLKERHISYEVGGHREESFASADLIVVSPGVPLRLPPLQEAIRAGKEVISEIELASRFLQGKVIGVTGSNGKTTTTSLIGEILKTAGFEVQVGGNIGVALTSLVDQSSPETMNVVELSSFQLEAIPTFRPNVAVALNLTPDHLDRYDSFEDYVQAKLNIFKNQTNSDFAVLNLEDQTLRKSLNVIRSKKFWFSTDNEVEQGTYFDGKDLVFRLADTREAVISSEAIRLPGKHNLENITAAITAARVVNAASAKIAQAVMRFGGVEHRLELVAEIEGVKFYNDSKATNTDATLKALEAFEAKIVLILGGRDKGSDFTVLSPLIKERVRQLILLGEASEKIRFQLSGIAPMLQAGHMEEAVRLAFKQAAKGDVVLLAPACASFDMFRDYEHRGRVFKESVERLRKG
ncbi:MAG: UDP-N-acetylmuramoyl-L-alanine--D-glutamate ligase [Acidobacteria bacterium]|nr:MAG: UDP-N-acetylmuramoyl-L-alanine--D-glutamate ligase [Acidobacteriota bacterium]